MSITYYCEMCGSQIRGKPKEVYIEGARLMICESCFKRVTERQKNINTNSQTVSPKLQKPLVKQNTKAVEKKPISEKRVTPKIELEIIDDYPEIIKKAREKLGWSTQALANRVMESENVIKRIEQGKLRPTIELAKKLEKVLGIKLLQPVSQDDEEVLVANESAEVTLGDLANIKTKKRV